MNSQSPNQNGQVPAWAAAAGAIAAAGAGRG